MSSSWPPSARELPQRSYPFEVKPATIPRGEAAQSASPRRLTLCSDAIKFLQWIQTSLPDLDGEVTLPALDQALLILTKEYFYRRQGAALHEEPPVGTVGFICLPQVFHEHATHIFTKQMELLRAMSFTPPSEVPSTANPPEEKPTQHLFIGEEIEDND